MMEAASMPLVLGGLGLRSARRASRPAYWVSWADASAVIRARHPDVATRLVEELEGRLDTPFLRAAAEARRTPKGTRGFEPPSWHAVADGARPQLRDPADFEPGGCDNCGNMKPVSTSRSTTEMICSPGSLFKRRR